MEKNEILKSFSKAEILFENNKYEEAYELYNLVTIELLKILDESRSIRKLSKGAGWIAAILTGGIGLEDLFIVPLVNKLLQSLLGINLEETLRTLYNASKQKLIILNIISKKNNENRVNYILLDFLLTYKLGRSFSQKDNISELVKLINPFIDTSIITGEELKYNFDTLINLLFDEVQIDNSITKYLNNVLLLFLLKQNLLKNKLYVFLMKEKKEFENDLNSESLDIEEKYRKILGVEDGIEPQKLKELYRNLMKRYHPDKYNHSTEKEKKMAEDKAKLINEAWGYFRSKYKM